MPSMFCVDGLGKKERGKREEEEEEEEKIGRGWWNRVESDERLA